MKKKKRLLAVDPGLKLGWAFFPENRYYPTKVGLIKPQLNSKADFFMRLHSTTSQFSAVVKKLAPQEVAIEWPGYFDSLVGGAAAKQGSLVKLAFGVGQLALIAHAFGAEFVPVRVTEWKGQIPKKVVNKIITKKLSAPRLRALKPEDDSWDAVGIGLYLRGVLYNEEGQKKV